MIPGLNDIEELDMHDYIIREVAAGRPASYEDGIAYAKRDRFPVPYREIAYELNSDGTALRLSTPIRCF